MSEMPIHQLPEEPDSPERQAVVERVILLSRVATSTAWHEDNLNDPEATPQDKRASRDRKRLAAQKLAEFDVLHGVAPPEEE